MKKIVASTALLACIATTGCQVVKDQAVASTSYSQLASWQQEAANVPASEKYKEGRIAVNGWLAGKQTELAIAGTGLFSQVDLSIPDVVKKKAADALGEPKGLEDLIADLIKAVFKNAQENRTKEASAISAQLDLYKWPDKSSK